MPYINTSINFSKHERIFFYVVGLLFFLNNDNWYFFKI